MGDVRLFFGKFQMEFIPEEVLHFLFDLNGTLFCAVAQDDEVISITS